MSRPDGAQDPFRVLSLSHDASLEDVRKAFRRLARQTHPDRGGSASAFHDVRVAYGALSSDLEAERRRWQVTPVSTPSASRYAAGLNPKTYPTCTVRISGTRDGKRKVVFGTDSRPKGWKPGVLPPVGGVRKASYAATETIPAFGVWIVSLDANTFRCVFGP